MAEYLSDYELSQSPGDAPPPRRPRVVALWIAAALLAAAAGFAFYFYNRTPAVPESATTAAKPSGAAADARGALGSDPLSITLPPIDQSDEVVRKLVSA